MSDAGAHVVVPQLSQLTLEPIGIVRTDVTVKAEAPRQPGAGSAVAGRIELLPGRNFEHALDDLAGWEYLWVIFWFHQASGWRPKVLPPRSSSGRKGVFATRAPHRPNPLGLSAVRLERIEGLTLHVGGIDMLDGSPVLDLKPYVPYADAHPGARSGWLDDERRLASGEVPVDPVSPWRVSFEPQAADRLAWIDARDGGRIGERIRATLALGPTPHPYRRIRPERNAWRLAVRDWRVRFTVAGYELRVIDVASGYRPAELAGLGEGDGGRLALHREFRRAFPG